MPSNLEQPIQGGPPESDLAQAISTKGKGLWRDPRIWLGLALGSVLTWLAFRGVDLEQVAEALKGADWTLTLLVFVLTYLVLWLRSIRWWLLLRGVGPTRTRDALHASFMGYTLNYLLPIRAGELVRAYLVGTRSGYSRAAALGTVVVERVIDALSILVIFAAVMPFAHFRAADSQLLDVLKAGTLILSAVALIAFALVLSMRHHTELLVGWLQRLLGKLAPAVARHVWRLGAFADGLRFGRDWLELIGLMLLSAIIWVVTVSQLVLLADALHLSLPWDAGWILLVGLAVGVTIPSAPGMIGTFHYSAIVVLLLYGVDRTEAVSYSILLHAVSVFPVVAVGLALAWYGHLSLYRLMSVGQSNR